VFEVRERAFVETCLARLALLPPARPFGVREKLQAARVRSELRPQGTGAGSCGACIRPYLVHHQIPMRASTATRGDRERHDPIERASGKRTDRFSFLKGAIAHRLEEPLQATRRRIGGRMRRGTVAK